MKRCLADRKKNQGQCTKKQRYGVLCDVHARQVAGTPKGTQYNKLIRRHFKNIEPNLLEQAAYHYCTVNGNFVQYKTKPSSWTSHVYDFIKKKGKVSAGGIYDELNKKVELNSSQIGWIIRELLNKDLIERMVEYSKGHKTHVYALKKAE